MIRLVAAVISLYAKLHRVSKNVPTLACCNFDTDFGIFWFECYR